MNGRPRTITATPARLSDASASDRCDTSDGTRPSRENVNILRSLRAIWSGLLEVPPESLGPASNFLELGGNSMLLLGLQASLDHAFGVELSPAELIACDSLAAMADLLERCVACGASP